MASASVIAPDALHSTSRPGRASAYVRAQRHSGRVRVLRTVIPLGAALASALVIAATFFNPFARMGLTLGPVSVSGTRVAMEGPRLTGFKKDARPYEVTATAAYQDIRKPNVIELKDMKARLVLDESGMAATLVSKTGIFDTQKEHLDLVDQIRITTDKGDEALLTSASVDMKAGTVDSREPVTITTATGRVDANAMQIIDSGKTIIFTGRVRVSLKNGAGPGAPSAPSTEAVKP